MDTQTIFMGTLVIVLLLVLVLIWPRYPIARYIVIARNDRDPKYIAIQDVEVIDNYGRRKDIVGIEGIDYYTTGFSNSAGALSSAPGATGDILFNGKNMGYVVDPSLSTLTVGPVTGFIPSTKTVTGYLVFVLSCPTRVSRINIRPADDDVSRVNVQHIKVYLLDKDKQVINGTEQVVPITPSIIPPSLHHITYA